MRTFTAISFPNPVKAALADLCNAEIPKARWVHPDDFHLTLRFIGNVDDDTLQRYQSVLARVRGEPFTLTLKGVGRFPQNIKKPPRVLWVDVTKPPELLALHKTISDALEAEGLPKDRHPDYNPHVTLARLRADRPIAELDQFLRQHTDFSLPPFPVEGFTLYESRTNPKGGSYTPLAVYPLG